MKVVITKFMNPGKLRHRITLLNYQTVFNEYRVQIKKWKPVRDCWALVNDGYTKEFLAAQQINNTLTHEVLMRFTKEIDVNMAILFEKRFFNIEGIRNVSNNNKLLILNCSELIDHQRIR